MKTAIHKRIITLVALAAVLLSAFAAFFVAPVSAAEGELSYSFPDIDISASKDTIFSPTNGYGSFPYHQGNLFPDGFKIYFVLENVVFNGSGDDLIFLGLSGKDSNNNLAFPDVGIPESYTGGTKGYVVTLPNGFQLGTFSIYFNSEFFQSGYLKDFMIYSLDSADPGIDDPEPISPEITNPNPTDPADQEPESSLQDVISDLVGGGSFAAGLLITTGIIIAAVAIFAIIRKRREG